MKTVKITFPMVLLVVSALAVIVGGILEWKWVAGAGVLFFVLSFPIAHFMFALEVKRQAKKRLLIDDYKHACLTCKHVEKRIELEPCHSCMETGMLRNYERAQPC